MKRFSILLASLLWASLSAPTAHLHVAKASSHPLAAIDALTTSIGGQKRTVEIKAAGGITLKGTLFSSAKPGPGILLFHLCDGNGRAPLDSLASQLAQQGFQVLTFDYRGIGESAGERFAGGTMQQGLEYWRTKWSGDAEAALKFLLSQSGVNQERSGVGGASCGVFQALLLAQRHSEQVKTLVLMAGPIDAGTKAFVERQNEISILGISSQEDQRSTAWTKEIVAASKNPAAKLLLYQNVGHGTRMLTREPSLEPIIVEWFKTKLQP